MARTGKTQQRELRDCMGCGKPFAPKKRQVYCSLDCRKPPIRLLPRPCQFCRNEFAPKRKDALYCKDLCRSRAGLLRRKAVLAEQGLIKTRQLETRECRNCGCLFDQKRWWQDYCDPQCAARARQQRRIERQAVELIERDFLIEHTTLPNRLEM
jgi:hypothetical protein